MPDTTATMTTPKLRIFSDAPLSASALEILKNGTASHELVFPARPPNRFLCAPSPTRRLKPPTSPSVSRTSPCLEIGASSLDSSDERGLYAL